MSPKHLTALLTLPNTAEPLRIAYLDQPAITPTPKATILLLHGFPQTSHQFRHVLPFLSSQNYRILAPDYRGAGNSSKPLSNDFRKTTMAADMIALLDHLRIKESVHVVGHDIGGKIAYALASRFPDRVRSVIWGENILPGTSIYQASRGENAVKYFHFIFHCVADLPEALVAGKERVYVSHFLEKITHNLGAFTEADVDFYANAYAQPGAMRCAFGVYRAFEEDAKENLEWLAENRKCRVPTMVLSGEKSPVSKGAEQMASEVTDEDCLEVGTVEGAGHYIAEENPEGFADAVLEFVEKH